MTTTTLPAFTPSTTPPSELLSDLDRIVSYAADLIQPYALPGLNTPHSEHPAEIALPAETVISLYAAFKVQARVLVDMLRQRTSPGSPDSDGTDETKIPS